MRSIVLLPLIALLGCAGQPTQQGDSPAPSEHRAAAEQAHADDVKAPENITPDKIMAAQNAGYRIVEENGQRMYCKRYRPTGTRVREQTACLSEREWELLVAGNKQNVEAMSRRQMPRQGK